MPKVNIYEVPASNLPLTFVPGMFLYAKLVLTNLLALPTRLEVINAIQHERFPQGLKEAYVKHHHFLHHSLRVLYHETNGNVVTKESSNVSKCTLKKLNGPWQENYLGG
jgi:hypothetical protein